MNKAYVLAVIVLGLALIAPIPNPGHPADEIGPGTFAPGNFVFPNELTVQGNFLINESALFVNTTSGRVGIGTLTPTATLDVRGNVNISNTLITSEICLNGVCEISWPAGGIWSNSSGNATFTAGRVGIGTTTPQTTLDVRGTRRVALEDTSTEIRMVGDEITLLTNPSSSIADPSRRIGQSINLTKQGSADLQRLIGSETRVFQEGGTTSSTIASEYFSSLTEGSTGLITGTAAISVISGGDADAQEGIGVATATFSGSLDEVVGLRMFGQTGGIATVTNITGIDILRQDTPLVEPTNRRAIWIREPTGTATNDYAIYQQGTQTNYFEGSLGLGTTQPTARLEIDGGLRLNTTVARPTCDADQRGTFWVQQRDAGEDDFVWACLRNSTQDHNWILMARGE